MRPRCRAFVILCSALSLYACSARPTLNQAAHLHLEDPFMPIGPPAPSGDSREGILTLMPVEPLEGALLAAVRFFDALIAADRYRLEAALEEELLRVNPRATIHTRSKGSLLGILLHPSRRAHLREGTSIHDLLEIERSRSVSLEELYRDRPPRELDPRDRAFELHLTEEGVRAFRGSLPGVSERFIVLVRGAPPHRIIGL